MFRSKIKSTISIVLTIAIGLMPCLLAQSQVVAPQELRQAVIDSAKARRQKIERIQGFFSSEPVRKAMASADLNLQYVQNAVPFLSAKELGQLEARVNQIEEDIVGGALTNQEITYILIALATAVIVLIIVDD
ncbi:MAG TPA: hypothetical protein VKZ59_06340 [Acidobacteriota bacterium]|nr:hypothetical protein [Acidobacteriota bacterium]